MQILNFISALLCLLPSLALASSSLDSQYRLKSIVPLVINKKEHPVYGLEVEHAVIKYLKKSAQIEVNREARKLALSELDKIANPALGEAKTTRLGPYVNLLKAMDESDTNADALIMVEIQKNPRGMGLLFVLINIKGGEILSDYKLDVANRFSLESFKFTTHRGLDKTLQAIPFDATISKRIGRRVVLDKGKPFFQVGMELPTYTVEEFEGETTLVETGEIILTQVGQDISFARIDHEALPLRVAANNKIRVPDHPRYQGSKFLAVHQKKDRQPASFLGGHSQGPVGNLGFIDLQLGGSLVNVGQKTSTGGGLTDKATYPMARFNVELWMTQRVFFDFGFQAGLSTGLGSAQQSSNVGDIRGAVGYRLPFAPEDDTAPIAHVQAGFSKSSFNTEPTGTSTGFLSTSYSGFMVGGGMTVPFARRWGIGFDVNGLLFGSVSEDPFTSGEATGVRGWDFSLRGYYRVKTNVDVEGRVQFLNNNADFDGRGNRGLRVVSSSQTMSSFMLGMTYYF